MPTIYSDKPSALHPAELGDPEFVAIGRLIRATAELEDLVNLFIMQMAKTGEGKVIAMLGQTPVSKRLNIAYYLARIDGPYAIEHYKACFDSGVETIFEVRNVVAHGVFVGKDNDGRWAFITAKIRPPEDGSAIQAVHTYATDDLKGFADSAEKFVPAISAALKLDTWREKRLGKPLRARRKAPPGQKPSAKRQPPPQSSEE